MIEDLLKAKLITPQQYKVYMLFQANELGRELFGDMMSHYFMDLPPKELLDESKSAYYVGRCSVLKDWYTTIIFVQDELRKINNDGANQPGR
jgi:hypothetical protein